MKWILSILVLSLISCSSQKKSNKDFFSSYKNEQYKDSGYYNRIQNSMTWIDGSDDGYVPLSNTKIISSLELEVKSIYDTSVLYEGRKFEYIICLHNWTEKDVRNGMYSSPFISCAVYHGETGCPDKWAKFQRICKSCLRWEEIKETRIIEEKKDEFEETLERLKKHMSQKTISDGSTEKQ